MEERRTKIHTLIREAAPTQYAKYPVFCSFSFSLPTLPIPIRFDRTFHKSFFMNEEEKNLGWMVPRCSPKLFTVQFCAHPTSSGLVSITTRSPLQKKSIFENRMCSKYGYIALSTIISRLYCTCAPPTTTMSVCLIPTFAYHEPHKSAIFDCDFSHLSCAFTCVSASPSKGVSSWVWTVEQRDNRRLSLYSYRAH